MIIRYYLNAEKSIKRKQTKKFKDFLKFVKRKQFRFRYSTK